MRALDSDINAPNNVIESYQLESSVDGYFRIDRNWGHMTIGDRLAYEDFDEFVFTVTARDSGYPPLQVRLIIYDG